MKKWAISILLAWLIFIGIDFLFHASLLAPLWEEDIAAIKPLQELFRLIPFGYLSFLLQTILIAYLFHRFFPEKPPLFRAMRFGAVVGLLIALGNILALYSYVDIPLKHLTYFNFVFFMEILAVVLALYHLQFSTNRKRVIIITIAIFFFIAIAGALIQNIRG